MAISLLASQMVQALVSSMLPDHPSPLTGSSYKYLDSELSLLSKFKSSDCSVLPAGGNVQRWQDYPGLNARQLSLEFLYTPVFRQDSERSTS